MDQEERSSRHQLPKYNIPSDFIPTSLPKEVRVVKELNTIDGVQADQFRVESVAAIAKPAQTYSKQPSEFILNTDFVGKRSATFDFNVPPFDPIVFSNNLIETMAALGVITLAAPQVGHLFRVIAVRGFDTPLFNPSITVSSSEKVVMEEADPCYPGATADIERSQAIRIRYLDAFGKFHTGEFAGITARVLQQAWDHLEGRVFLDYLGDLKRKRVLSKASKRVKR